MNGNQQPMFNAPNGGWIPPTAFTMPPQYVPPAQYYQNHPNMQNSYYQQQQHYQQTTSYYNSNNNPNFQRNNPRQKNMKAKADKSVASCDICERDFRTLQKYEEHISEHVKCDYDGCNFEAHFKIVAFHKKNFHGKYSNKLKFDTPEDIKKWREERKKNFPTLENIKKKKSLEEEREKCGNVLGNKLSQRHMKHGGGGKNKNKRFAKQRTSNVVETPVAKVPVTASMELEEGEIEPDVPVTASSALTSIFANYNSDDDESTNCDNTKQQSLPKHNKVKPTRNGKCKKGQKKKQLAPLYKKKSLLRKLLAHEITKERNEILQAVRFIVQNNFFDS